MINSQHRVEPGRVVDLAQWPTSGKELYEEGKAAAQEEFKGLRDELAELQHRLYSEGKRKLLIIFQAMDAGGKDGRFAPFFAASIRRGCR